MTKRDRIVVGVLALVAAIAGFWFLALKPKRAEADAAAARAATAQSQLLSATAALSSAQSARTSFETDYATIARLGKAVPDDDDAASVVYQITTAAREAGIDFRSLTVGGAGGVTASASSSSSSSSASGSSSAAAAPTSTGAAATTLPPGVVAGTDGMNRLPFTFVFDGDYFALTKLLRLLHSFTTVDGDRVKVGGRLLTVESVSLGQGRHGFPDIKATVAATAYLSGQPITLPGGASASPAQPGAPATTTAPSTQAAGPQSSVPAATVTPGVAR